MNNKGNPEITGQALEFLQYCIEKPSAGTVSEIINAYNFAKTYLSRKFEYSEMEDSEEKQNLLLGLEKEFEAAMKHPYAVSMGLDEAVSDKIHQVSEDFSKALPRAEHDKR